MYRKDLEILTEKHLLRVIRDRGSAQGPVITVGGKRYINFASNDYLGLAQNPAVVAAAGLAAKRYGFGAGASRLLSGGTLLHGKLERLVAAWKGADAAVVFNSGYAANTGIIPVLASEGDVIFSDELNHASIIDGCRLSRAKTVIYRHKDISHLRKLLKSETGRKKLIVTDTVFSMDGDIAPLRDIYNLCSSANPSPVIQPQADPPGRTRRSLLLYLDDAHGTGVLGNGKGALAHFGIKPEPWIIQMGTFSKALGSFGAFAAGDGSTMQWLVNSARSLIFSTALPAAVIAAAMAAVDMIKRDPAPVHMLWHNRSLLCAELAEMGFDVMLSETPIVPIRTSSVKEAISLSEFLYERGIYVPAIRPPSVSVPRIRIVVTAAHQKMHIKRLLGILQKWRTKGKASVMRGMSTKTTHPCTPPRRGPFGKA